jgi:hypothetical protein
MQMEGDPAKTAFSKVDHAARAERSHFQSRFFGHFFEKCPILDCLNLQWHSADETVRSQCSTSVPRVSGVQTPSPSTIHCRLVKILVASERATTKPLGPMMDSYHARSNSLGPHSVLCHRSGQEVASRWLTSGEHLATSPFPLEPSNQRRRCKFNELAIFTGV